MRATLGLLRLWTCARSAVEDSGAADRRRAAARALREILGQFPVPGACRFGHRALGRHPLFDCPPAVITLVRFHWSISAPRRIDHHLAVAKHWLKSTSGNADCRGGGTVSRALSRAGTAPCD